MAQVLKREFLESLLNHEIKELLRIRTQLNLAEHVPEIENITLAVIPVESTSPAEVLEPIRDVLRDSDVIFPDSNNLILLLPGTDEMGALHILEGLSDFLGEGFRFSYVVYPRDGESAGELLKRLRDRTLSELGISVP